MDTFKLQRGGGSFTSISNNFIEKYMPQAPGEFVKVYIYLIKCIGSGTGELSLSHMADIFDMTEKDFVRAVKYWNNQGLLSAAFAEDGSINALTISQEPKPTAGLSAAKYVNLEARPAEDDIIAFETQKQYSRNDLEAFSKNSDNSLMIYGIQKLVGRPLGSMDINTIMFMENELKFPEDLVEYVFEYCAGKRKTGIRYIEKVAISWHEQGVRDIKGAKMLNAIYSETCYPVMKAFGLTGRNPADEERRYIGTWVISYGFSLNMILEACNRTINSIHKPSFEYAASILKKWKAAGFTTLEDVNAADSARAEQETAKKKAAPKQVKAPATGFNNFHQRSYDYDELEAQLIGR